MFRVFLEIRATDWLTASIRKLLWKPNFVTFISVNGMGIAVSFFGLNLYASSSGKVDSYQIDEIVILWLVSNFLPQN